MFEGLDFRNKEQPKSRSLANRKAHEDGWKDYSRGDAEQTVADFRRACEKHKFLDMKKSELIRSPVCDVEALQKYLQKLLCDFGVEWIVAPYSAAAQVCFERRETMLPLTYIAAVLPPERAK